MNIRDKYQDYVQCATVFIMHTNSKLLLLEHTKLVLWVPPGGKLEPGESPVVAGLRECFEDTGLALKLLQAQLYDEDATLQGIGVNDAGLKPYIQYIQSSYPVDD